MPRARIFGFIACVFSLVTGAIFFYFAFCNVSCACRGNLCGLSDYSYYSITIPISLIALIILGAGFWIGWTILTIKVAPPMPEIVDKKDFSKIKAFFLCIVTLAVSVLFVYGIYIRSYWSLAIPAAVATLVILGMIFWVGFAIITVRSTLPEEKK